MLRRREESHHDETWDGTPSPSSISLDSRTVPEKGLDSVKGRIPSQSTVTPLSFHQPPLQYRL